MGSDRFIITQKSKPDYSRYLDTCEACASLAVSDMLIELGPYIIAGIALLAVSLWIIRSGSSFQAPQTQVFDPKIFQYFTKQNSLFVTSSEQVLFKVLYNGLTPNYYVFAKVRLEDIIGVSRGKLSAQAVWSLRGRVKSRHVDFLITTLKGQPVMIVELDGTSHHSKIAQRADDLKDGLAKAVDLPLKRVRVGQDFGQFLSKIKAELRRR